MQTKNKNKNKKTQCTSKDICNVYFNNRCKGYPCPGYTYIIHKRKKNETK